MRAFSIALLLVCVAVGCNRATNPASLAPQEEPDVPAKPPQQAQESNDSSDIMLGKIAADLLGEEFDENKWSADRENREQNRELSAEEWKQLEIVLGKRPHPDQTKQFTKDQLNYLFGNKDTHSIVERADRAEFYFVRTNGNDGFLNRLDAYERLGEQAQLSAEQQEKISDQLLDARNYGWAAARKGCVPSPGIALKLATEKEELTVVFCFACNLLVYYHDNMQIGGEDFDMMRPQFVKILKSLYPNNELIQGFPSNGCGLTETE